MVIGTHPHHRAVAEWFEIIGEREAVWFCRPTQQGLLRLLSVQAVMTPYGEPARTNNEAWAIYDALAADERIALQWREPEDLNERWRRFSSRPSASPKLWMDAYLAAFAAASNATLVTFDRAFRQFNGLDVLILGEHG